jgi:hypothetical protein
MAGCGPVTQYSLTISASEGGEVTTPGEGTFTYSTGTRVSLNAIPDADYQFASWTGDVGTIGNVNAATTTIIMRGNYTITSHFYNPEIRTWYDLNAVRNSLISSYSLMNDLNSTTLGYDELASPTANGGKGWDPIGWGYWASGYDEPIGEIFKGTFDGQGHEIRDLYISSSWGTIGLFGCVGEGGIISNISVMNATVGEGVGGLVRLNEDTVRSLDVAPMSAAGGLVGYNGGTVSNSYSTGSVTGNVNVGGLVGENYGTVSNSHFTGNVTGLDEFGGLVGANGGTVSNSYYNYNEVLINGQNIITIGALFGEDFDQWLANDKFLDVNERLSQENGYYVVNNVSDFKQLLAFGQNTSLKFRLTNDLDLGGEPNFYIPYFAGELDGNGHTISNLSCDFSFVSKVGLFGYLATGGKVTDLVAYNVSIIAYDHIGSLVGDSHGIVGNSCSSGNVTGRYCVGGLVGTNGGSVSNSYSTASVSGASGVGGLIGTSWSTVSGSYSTGSVTGDFYVGGLIGSNTGSVSNSYATGSVTAVIAPGKGWDIGGLVGCNYGTGSVSNSYSTGSVTGNVNVGGLVGANSGTVSRSFWDAQTSGQATSAGGTGKTTAQMKNIITFSDATWNIIAVALNETNSAYIWNIVNNVTYPFLSWQP